MGMMFAGKKVVVTGGSAGIGLETARLFSEQGAEVLMTGRNRDKLERTVGSIDSAHVHMLVWDVTNFDELAQKCRACEELLGGTDIWVNNAGVANEVDFHGDFFGTTMADWDTVMNTNLKSLFFICQQVIDSMRKNKVHGHIINVCSEQAFRPGASTPYGLSKIAVDHLTKGLGRRFIKDGIVINGVAPGATNTSLQNGEELLSPKQIAEVIAFLASEQGKIIAGETIIADRCEHLGVNWISDRQR